MMTYLTFLYFHLGATTKHNCDKQGCPLWDQMKKAVKHGRTQFFFFNLWSFVWKISGGLMSELESKPF